MAISPTTTQTRASLKICAIVVHALQTTDAELGLAFDGDGDRLGIVTKEGHTIYPDRQMMLFAQ
jgi:phosphomannomutase